MLVWKQPFTFGRDHTDCYLYKPVIREANNGNSKPILKCIQGGEFIVVFDGFTGADGREQNTHIIIICSHPTTYILPGFKSHCSDTNGLTVCWEGQRLSYADTDYNFERFIRRLQWLLSNAYSSDCILLGRDTLYSPRRFGGEFFPYLQSRSVG
jgi:hypothetical protein